MRRIERMGTDKKGEVKGFGVQGKEEILTRRSFGSAQHRLTRK
jgi:hypothetical protein